VFQIARRKLVDEYRRSAVSHNEIEEDETISDPAPTPEMQVLHHEMRGDVLGLVKCLGPRKQEVILLRYFGGLQNNEIASVLELDERTISSYLSRALGELRASSVSDTNNLFLTKEYTYE
jgi:RNA polymerase sigma factor (sigma-70 family)